MAQGCSRGGGCWEQTGNEAIPKVREAKGSWAVKKCCCVGMDVHLQSGDLALPKSRLGIGGALKHRMCPARRGEG